MVNIANKRCGHPGCNKQPWYGMEGSKTREFCAQHRKEGMVYVISKWRGHPGCNKLPSDGVEGGKTKEFCSEHKKKGTVDVTNKRRATGVKAPCGSGGVTRQAPELSALCSRDYRRAEKMPTCERGH
eukprot:g3893.t1